MYHVIFKYGQVVRLGRCVIASETDTTVASYWNTTESEYVNFTSGLTPKLGYGESLYYSTGYKTNDFLGRVNNIAASVITIGSNPGQRAYHEVLKNGYIEPFTKGIPTIYSYPLNGYAGARLNTIGEYYNTYAQANPNNSDATLVDTNSVISLYFKKIDKYDEVKINVRVGSEVDVIKAINKAFRAQKDIDFSSTLRTIHGDIISIKSIESPFVKGIY